MKIFGNDDSPANNTLKMKSKEIRVLSGYESIENNRLRPELAPRDKGWPKLPSRRDTMTQIVQNSIASAEHYDTNSEQFVLFDPVTSLRTTKLIAGDD